MIHIVHPIIRAARYVLIGWMGALIALAGLERDWVGTVAMRAQSAATMGDPIEEATLLVRQWVDGRMNKMLPNHGLIPVSPALEMAWYGNGACGNISFLLIEVLGAMDMTAVPVQILDADGLNRHVIVKVFTRSGPAFVDPLYNHAYRKEDGTWATEEELLSSWDELTKTALEKGIRRYPIVHGIQFTNWKAAGRLGKFVRSMMALLASEQWAQHFSFRGIMPSFYATRIFMTFMLLIASVLVERQIRG